MAGGLTNKLVRHGFSGPLVSYCRLGCIVSTSVPTGRMDSLPSAIEKRFGPLFKVVPNSKPRILEVFHFLSAMLGPEIKSFDPSRT